MQLDDATQGTATDPTPAQQQGPPEPTPAPTQPTATDAGEPVPPAATEPPINPPPPNRPPASEKKEAALKVIAEAGYGPEAAENIIDEYGWRTILDQQVQEVKELVPNRHVVRIWNKDTNKAIEVNRSIDTGNTLDIWI